MLALWGLLLTGSLVARPAWAQTSAASGSITGRVVDAATLNPLSGATVELARVPPGASTATRSATTDAEGEYRFERVPPGRYRIEVRRLGYTRGMVDVDLQPAAVTRLSLGLDVGPVLLPPLEVKGEPSPSYHRGDATSPDSLGTRGAVERRRQARYVSLDVRELTHAEVVEAATLMETDLFRALQRAPGVGTRDDYTATMWTRGAPWDQTRVYFDGLPLFNPTHAGWLFSAVNPDAVGEVVFHPGARPAIWGEGAAAVLDLQSRAGGGGGPVRGRGELSLASARLALDGESRDERFQWMVAARRTYVDLITGLAEAVTGGEDVFIPYDFSDVVGRVDGKIGEGWAFKASGILEEDHLRGDFPGLLQGNRGRWGNRSGQISVTAPLGPVQAKVGAGETRFRAAIVKEPRTARSALREDPTLPALESLIRHEALTVEITPRGPSERSAPWSLGFQVVEDSVGYEGPFSLLGELAVVLPRDTTPLNVLQLGSRLRYRAAWAERRVDLGRLQILGGVRAEWGDSVLNGGELRVAPRLSAQWRPGEATALSVGWGRAWQYTQDIAPVAGPLGPQLHLTHLWILAQRAGYSAIRADIGTVTAERWLGRRWLLGGTLYRRLATGVEVPNPDSGRVTPDRDPSATAENVATGMEISLRKLSGRWSGAFGYSFGRSRMRAVVVDVDTARFDFAGSADIRHALDATLLARVGEKVRVGGAFTYGSGVPYTRLIIPDRQEGGGSVMLGLANEMRTPSYASLDLTADYTTLVGSWRLTAYAQLRNLFDRDNAVTYTGSSTCLGGQATSAGAGDIGSCRDGAVDRFQTGIPRLPLVGVRFSF